MESSWYSKFVNTRGYLPTEYMNRYGKGRPLWMGISCLNSVWEDVSLLTVI